MNQISDAFFGSITDNLNYANMCVLGWNWDQSSSYRNGAKQAPDFIRQATSKQLYNQYTIRGNDIIEKWQIFDGGNIELNGFTIKDAQQKVHQTIQNYNKYDMRFLFLGGDHLTTYFTVKSYILETQDSIGILYFDAHPDLYDIYGANKYSHACTLRRIIDECRIDTNLIYQIGIRSSTPEQDNYAKEQNITTFSTADIKTKGSREIAKEIKNKLPKKTNLYLSFDMDILDPAFAPGVGNPEPGGLSTFEVLELLQNLQAINIIASDIVELNPQYDPTAITAFTSAKIIQEMLEII
ncbi:MAG: agmatinase [Asgard group archaeon]|nr:agmatinase [Asgard group archaeon]